MLKCSAVTTMQTCKGDSIIPAYPKPPAMAIPARYGNPVTVGMRPITIGKERPTYPKPTPVTRPAMKGSTAITRIAGIPADASSDAAVLARFAEFSSAEKIRIPMTTPNQPDRRSCQ